MEVILDSNGYNSLKTVDQIDRNKCRGRRQGRKNAVSIEVKDIHNNQLKIYKIGENGNFILDCTKELTGSDIESSELNDNDSLSAQPQINSVQENVTFNLGNANEQTPIEMGTDDISFLDNIFTYYKNLNEIDDTKDL